MRYRRCLLLLAALTLLGGGAQARANIMMGGRIYDEQGRLINRLTRDGKEGYGSGVPGANGMMYLVNGGGFDRFEVATGNYRGSFAVDPHGATADWPWHSLLTAHGELIAVRRLFEESARYDARTGAYLGTVGTPGVRLNMFEMASAVVGPDGDLYMGSIGPDVYRFDGKTYEPKGVFAHNPLEGEHRDGHWHMNGRAGELAFGPDGTLYASDEGTRQIVKFDGETGEFLGVFAPHGAFDIPGSLLFHPDGDLLVSSFNFDGLNEVLRLDGITGELKGIFAERTGGGMVYMPSGSTSVPPDPTPVPEPATAVVLLAGAAGLIWRKRGQAARATESGPRS